MLRRIGNVLMIGAVILVVLVSAGAIGLQWWANETLRGGTHETVQINRGGRLIAHQIGRDQLVPVTLYERITMSWPNWRRMSMGPDRAIPVNKRGFWGDVLGSDAERYPKRVCDVETGGVVVYIGDIGSTRMLARYDTVRHDKELGPVGCRDGTPIAMRKAEFDELKRVARLSQR